jgi:hypothetical protein
MAGDLLRKWRDSFGEYLLNDLLEVASALLFARIM